MSTEKEEQDSKEEQKNRNELSSKVNPTNLNTKDNTQPTNNTANITNNRRNPKKLFWSYLTIADTIQIILLIVNIIMLYAFIESTSDQYKNTIEALKKTDTTNVYTKRSIELSERVASSSDSSTNRSLAISEKSLLVAQQSLDVNRLAMIATNTPYIQIQAHIIKFVPDTIHFKVVFKNVGNTPALSLHLNAVFSFTPSNERPIPHDPTKMLGTILSPHDSLMFDPTPPIYIAIGQELYNSVLLGDNTFKIAGVLIYDDIFNCKYRSDFYFVYDIRDRSFINPNVGNNYRKIK